MIGSDYVLWTDQIPTYFIQPIHVSLSSSDIAQMRYTSWCPGEICKGVIALLKLMVSWLPVNNYIKICDWPSTTFPSESVLQALIRLEELSAE